MIQLKVETKMLLLERFFRNGGWLEIFLVAIYGSVVIYFMQDIKKTARWRLISWTVFSAWFFIQLFLGIIANEAFLLTGKLHLPIPAMMIGGPIYRGQLSVMAILFLNTIVLSGPAWCSQLCYFGAVDGLFSGKGKAKAKSLTEKRFAIKGSLLVLVIVAAIALRWFGISPLFSTIAGLVFGIIGLAVILIFSKSKGKMVHCVLYCPIGTLVNYLKFLNPFRLKIEYSCTRCMACTATCRYDALNLTDIEKYKPGITCTLCGDCLKSCHANSIRYKFLNLTPENARKLYLYITISLHAIFLAMGRI
jgi:polyferredoxin